MNVPASLVAMTTIALASRLSSLGDSRAQRASGGVRTLHPQRMATEVGPA